MSLAGLHLQLNQQGPTKTAPEGVEVNTLKYYFDRLNHAKSWQALGSELGLLNKSYMSDSRISNHFHIGGQ